MLITKIIIHHYLLFIIMIGVYDAVRRMSNSGARVMMITGDSEGTAVSIAKYAGVYNPHEIRSRILSGK